MQLCQKAQQDVFKSVRFSDQAVKAVAATLAMGSFIEQVRSGQVLAPCRCSNELFSTSLQMVAQNRGAPVKPTLTTPDIVGGNSDEAS